MSLSSAPRNSGVVAARKTAWKGPIAPRVRSTVATTAALLLRHGKCAHRGKRGHGSSPTIAAIVSWLREEPVGTGTPAAEAAPAGHARIQKSHESARPFGFPQPKTVTTCSGHCAAATPGSGSAVFSTDEHHVGED